MVNTAYSYIRFSTRDQIKGDSLRRQTEAAALWCKQKGIALADSYQDLGVSAFHGKNAETGSLALFLALIRRGRIPKGSYLIVESLDRVSRNSILDAFELFLSIIKSGVVVVTLVDGHVYDKEKINGGNFTDLIISLTVLSRAHEESHTKAVRLGASWEAKRRNIKTSKLTGRCVAWLNLSPDKSKFEIISDRSQVVQRIFEMASHGHGANGIAKTLQHDCVPTFGRSKAWHLSYIKKILDNRAVIGEFAPASKRNGKRVFFDAVQDYYPAVVTRETFATVQQLRKARPSYKGRSTFNVFSRLAYDRATGSPMAYVNKNRAKGWHYLIAYAALQQSAAYVTWQYDDFLSVFLFVCQKAALQKPERADDGVGKLNIARMELDEIAKQIARLVDFLATGQSTGVETRLREMEQRKLALQRQINDLENTRAAKPTDVSKVNWKDSAALRENLRATVKRITVDAGARSFHAEFLDGRVYTFKQEDEEVVIESPDNI
jgi:DNA invertase Pin-like site-specific DNA recombinase